MAKKRGFLFDAIATASVSLVRAAGAVATFAFAAVASSVMGPADAGIFFVSVTWAIALAILVRWGSSDLILLTFAPLARSWRRKALPAVLARYMHNSLLRLSGLILPVMLGLGLMIHLGWLSPVRMDLFFIFALTLAMVVQQVTAAAIKAAGRPVQASLVEFCFVALFVIAAYLVFRGWVDASPRRGFETVYLSGAVISALVLMTMKGAKIEWTRPLRPNAMRTSLRRSHSFAMSEMSDFLATWAAFLMMPLFLSAHDAGIYNAALRIAALTQLVTISVPSVFIPRLATALQHRDRIEARRLTWSVKLIMALAGIALFLGVAIFGKWALGLFGTDFIAGYGPLLIMTAGLCGAMALGPAGAILNVMGHEKITLNVAFIGAFLTLALAIPALYFHGITGAATVTALSAIARKALLVWFEIRASRLKPESPDSF